MGTFNTRAYKIGWIFLCVLIVDVIFKKELWFERYATMLAFYFRWSLPRLPTRMV